MNASHRTAASLTLFLALGLFACREDAPAQEGPATPAPKQGDLPTLGAAAPKIVVSLFTDYQCPNCRRAGDLAARLVDRWPDDVQVRFHHMPLEIHPLAVRAGTAAQAAHKQGAFLCVHTALTKTRNLWNELGESEFDRFALEVLVPRCALDPATFQRDLDDPATAAIVLAARERARDLGVPGTPSVYVNGLEADAWPRPGHTPAKLLNALVRRELRDIAAGGRGLDRCDEADWACRVFDRVVSNTGDEVKTRLFLH